MRRKAILALGILLSVGIIAAPAISAFGASPKVSWRLQHIVPLSIPVHGEGIVWMAKNIEEASEGNIVLTVYEPGKLVAPFEILDAVSTGKIESGAGIAGFWAGKLPAAPIFSSLPFGPEAGEYLAWMFQGNGLKLYQEMFDQAGYKVKVLPCIVLVPESSGWFRKQIKSVEDLKGLKIRFFGYGGQAMQKLGAAVTLTPAGEIFPALERGVLDATEYSMPSLDERLGFYKVAKYNYFPGWHQQATVLDIIINRDKWNSLTKSQQKLIEMGTMASITYSIVVGEATQARVIKANEEKRGVKNLYWSDEMLAAFKKAWEEVATELSAKDPFFKKAYEDLSAFRKEYHSWQSMGYFPRNCGK